MSEVRSVDVTDEVGFRSIPPCADPSFDHRTCDYWEDDARGSKAARSSWLMAAVPPSSARPALAGNPFAPTTRPDFNPFDPRAGATRPRPAGKPFGVDEDAPLDNPFAPRRDAGPGVATDSPRKLQLLARGLVVFGTYAKVLEVDGQPVAYCQFGPLSAYPRASRVRDLYPQLPSSPLPAVITCIATAREARRAGHAKRLVESVVVDLAGRGFSAVETYPEPSARPDATSAATPAFWLASGFALAVDDPRFPVMRREL